MPKLASLIVDLQVQNAQLKAGLDEARQEIRKFADGVSQVGDLLKGVFSFEVAKAGLERFGEFLREGTVALAAEEKSAGRLSAAFASLGYDAKKVAPYFNELAESLEHEVLVDGETIRQVEQLLVQFGVAPKDIEKTTRAVLDYSAATGKDAVGATQQLLTSILSGHGEIKKMGVSIQETGDSAKDLGLAVDQLSNRFGGSAAGATQNLAGQLGHLQKAQEDLGKAFAKFFVESDTGKTVIKALTDAMDGMTYALSKEGREEAASVQRTEALTKLRERLLTANQRLALEQGRQGSFMFSAGALEDAKRERDAILEKIKLLEVEKEKANRATDEESARARAVAAAAETAASAQAKEIQAQERRKKATEEAAAAAKKAAQERTELFRKLTEEAKRWAEALDKADMQEERAKASAQTNIAERQRAFAEAGTTRGPDTRGFATFQDALDKLSQSAIREAELRHDAAMAEVSGQHAQQAALEVLADQQKDAAEQAGKAADAFTELKKSTLEAAKAARDAMISKAIPGPISGLIQAGTQGAVAGGPLGAAVGVGLDLLTQSNQFKQITDMTGKVIQAVSDGLGKLLENVLPFFALLEPLGAAVGAITGVLAGVLRPAFELLWDALKPVIMVVLTVAKVLASFWNGVVGMIQDLLKALGGISIFGAHPLGFLNDWAKGLDSSKVNLQGVDDAMSKLNSSTYDSVDAQQKQTDAQKDLTSATEKATASMTNVPSGYKVALARFEAANGDALRGAGGAGPLGSPPALGGGGAAGPAGGGGGVFGGGSGSGGGPGGGAGARSQNLVQVFLDGDEVLHRLQVRQGSQVQRQVGRRTPVNMRLVGAT